MSKMKRENIKNSLTFLLEGCNDLKKYFSHPMGRNVVPVGRSKGGHFDFSGLMARDRHIKVRPDFFTVIRFVVGFSIIG